MALYINVYIVLLIQHLGQLSQRFLASFIDLCATRLEQKLIRHGYIYFTILLGYGQLITVETQQSVFHATQQILYLCVLCVHHIL